MKRILPQKSKKLALLIPLALVAILGGCAEENNYAGLQTSTLNKVTAQPATHKKLGIAFGGGGVRGFMHLGVIKALEENHIKADLVTGSSAGSIAAILYASGLPYTQIEKEINDLGQFQVFDLVLSKQGMINGKKLANWIDNTVPQKDLKNMAIPVAVTASDMTNRESVLITQGDPGKAAQTSSSIPGAFIPVQNNKKMLVDGGILDVVPIDYAKAMGADVVLGVDIYCGNQTEVADNSGRMVLNTIRMLSCKLNEPQLKQADILIQPDFEPENMGSFESRDEAIKAGYQATLKIIPKLKKLLNTDKVHATAVSLSSNKSVNF